jgi:hypothetical protein
MLTTRGIEELDCDTHKILIRQLISISLGSAKAMPISYGFSVEDIYSEKDGITGPFNRDLKSNPNYNVRYVQCLTPKSELIDGKHDHAFLGQTYQTNLRKHINLSRRMYGFYSCKIR